MTMVSGPESWPAPLTDADVMAWSVAHRCGLRSIDQSMERSAVRVTLDSHLTVVSHVSSSQRLDRLHAGHRHLLILCRRHTTDADGADHPTANADRDAALECVHTIHR